MRISDWSSDVCSSDLLAVLDILALDREHAAVGVPGQHVDVAVAAETLPEKLGQRDLGGSLPPRRLQRGGDVLRQGCPAFIRAPRLPAAHLGRSLLVGKIASIEVTPDVVETVSSDEIVVGKEVDSPCKYVGTT